MSKKEGLKTGELLLLEDILYLSKKYVSKESENFENETNDFSENFEQEEIPTGDHYCIKSKKGLAKDLNVSLKTIYNYLLTLEKYGFIYRVKKYPKRIYVNMKDISKYLGGIDEDGHVLEGAKRFSVYLDHIRLLEMDLRTWNREKNDCIKTETQKGTEQNSQNTKIIENKNGHIYSVLDEDDFSWVKN